VESIEHAYSPEPTKNPFTYLRSVWRLIRLDPEKTTDDAAVVELAFARSKVGRRFARWEETLAFLKRDPKLAAAFSERRAFGPIVLADLERLPEGTLGRVFADHCRARKINPNLVHVPPDDEVGWFLNHLYQTHDIWHVITGWGNDLTGEVGLGGFYAAQFGSPPFFGYMFALVMTNTIWRRAAVDAVFAATSAGYRMGKNSEPLFGVDWDDLWGKPFSEVRARFAIDRSEIIGEGIRVAA
jgi:ubiquinone biosynthesis protein COQ4